MVRHLINILSLNSKTHSGIQKPTQVFKNPGLEKAGLEISKISIKGQLLASRHTACCQVQG